MIDNRLKKFAQANGMTADQGVIYGALHGYACTLCYNEGAMQLFVSTRFEASTKQDALRLMVDQKQVDKEFRVRDIRYTPGSICVLIYIGYTAYIIMRAFHIWIF